MAWARGSTVPGIARAEAIRLAKHILDLDGQLKLDDMVKVSEAMPLLEEKSFRAVGAAKCFVAWYTRGAGPQRGCVRLSGGRECHPHIVGEHSAASAEAGRRQTAEQCPVHGCDNQDDL